ncbi:MAG: VOC family protein [Gammaproteobacteria bacterium]|nr:VOC family protein [Gammaproteobacteria bacterium]
MSNTIHDVYAYLCVKNVDDALEFYKRAFGATEHFRLTEPNGRVGHAEIYLGSSILMLAEEFPEMGFTAPTPDQAAPITLHLHVDNADAMFKDAVAAGASEERSPEDQFYGERSGALRDPFGYRWLIGHSIEDVGVDEMQSRYENLFEQAS